MCSLIPVFLTRHGVKLVQWNCFRKATLNCMGKKAVNDKLSKKNWWYLALKYVGKIILDFIVIKRRWSLNIVDSILRECK